MNNIQGPWTAPPNRSQFTNVREFHNKDGKRIGNISFHELSDEDQDTAARMMAAAPALLKALEQLKEAVEYTPLGIRGIKAVEFARMAIASTASGQPCPHKYVMDDDHPTYSCCQVCGDIKRDRP